jgi:peptidyl-prolyl cis-trans isomerase D
MLQRLRDGLQAQKWLAWVVLGLIGATFVFWGGTNSLDFNGVSQNDAAKVNGEEISADEARQQWAETQSRWAQQFNTDIPAEQAAKMQDDILDQLILQKLITSRLKDQKYRVSDAKVLEEVQGISAFKGVDGKFDPNQARAVLRQYNKDEQTFFDETRRGLVSNQLQQGIAGSYFLTAAESRRLYNLENEEREVQYVQFPAEKFAGNEPIDEAEVKAYYEKNGDRFMTPEYVSLDYAELRLEQLATQVTPTEDELRKLYEDNKANYVQAEQRHALQIVIQGPDDAAARKQAEEVAAEARSGKNFGELARKYSKDPVSAAKGGDVEWVAKNDFPGPFTDTLFGMQVGEIAGPVKSDYGYLIIKLEEIHAAQEKPFEAVRAELDSQYRSDRAAELFGERQDAIGEALEKGDADLDKIAQSLGLTRGSIEQFRRGGGGEPLGSGAELQQAVFSDATLNQGKIGGPVELGEDRLVLVKVTSHHDAAVKPLAEVHDEIVALVRHEHGVAAAKAAADAAMAKLAGGEKIEAVAGELSVTAEPAKFVSRGDPSIPAALRTAVFEAPRPADKPVVKSATLDDGSSVVFVVSRTRVADTTQNPQLVQQETASLMQRAASGDIAAYVNEARRTAKIVKNPKVFD